MTVEPFELRLLDLEIQALQHDRFASALGDLRNVTCNLAEDGYTLISGLAAHDGVDSLEADDVAMPIDFTLRQVIGVDVDADRAQQAVRDLVDGRYGHADHHLPAPFVANVRQRRTVATV